MSKYLIEILKKMCELVGADFSSMDFKKEHWFWEFEWTTEVETTFKDWFVKYLMDNKEARKELMTFPRKNKKDIKKLVDGFVWNHGWKLKS